MLSRHGSLTLLVSILCLAAGQTDFEFENYGPDDEARLKSEILTDYDRTVRPYSPCIVYVDVILLQLNKLSIEDQEMSVTCVIFGAWDDDRLQWDPTDHKNLTSINLEFNTVWQPRLLVENSVEKISVLGESIKPPIRVSSSGAVNFLIPTVIKVFCETRILRFPFDSQGCHVRIFAWGYSQKEIIVYPNPDSSAENMHYYLLNGEWDYQSSELGSKFFQVAEGYYMQEVRASFYFRRKWVFLSLTMIVPAVLNSLLMSAVFALPFESGEKMSYSLTVLLTFIVLLTLVADSLPPISTEISALQMHLTGVMCLGTMATLLTVGTVTMYNRPPHAHKPHWLVFLCTRILKPLICKSKCSVSPKSSRSNPNIRNKGALSSPSEADNEYTQSQMKTRSFASSGSSNTPRTPFTLLSTPPASLEHSDDGSVRGSSTSVTPRQPEVHGSPGKYLSVDDSRQLMESGCRPDEGPKQDSEDITWQEVALIVDAVCLRVTSFLILAGTGTLIIFYVVSY